MKTKSVGIVGTGPAALMAGTVILENGHKVVFFDQKKAVGRKFLVAGNGGFNLTNDSEINQFVSHYDSEIIKKSVRLFDNNDFRDFLEKIGIETFVGSSGKIFPLKGIKPIDVLKAWQSYLLKLGAIFKMEHVLTDFNESELIFNSNDTENVFQFDHFVFALGGNSWSITGSDGKWFNKFVEKGIACKKFESSNSGFELINHSHLKEHAGKTIKNCKVFCENIEIFGELVISEYGIEGPPIYAMNANFRNKKDVYIDFKPTFSIKDIEQKLKKAKNVSEGLRDLKLPKVTIAWLKLSLKKEVFQNKSILAKTVKSFKLEIVKLRPIDEVISTIGGVEMNAINDSFQLKKFPKAYCIGEMLDWDAPTGGYLIQGCVSSGYTSATAIIAHS
ncbi:MAG: hypothetical protein RI883_309 [Bacteroidota bacterium]|jgi:uncharacterized flavoprotein (TIGR03862 family)